MNSWRGLCGALGGLLFLALMRVAWLQSKLTVYEEGLNLGVSYAILERRVLEAGMGETPEDWEMAERLAGYWEKFDREAKRGS